jgi:hypothetical protein
MLLPKAQAIEILRQIDFGSSVAETDQLLEAARVETSTFQDLLLDRVDLVPGTKGSGKSALNRIITDFLSQFLMQQRKIVVAYGVQAEGDSVFHAFREQFDTLSEDEFINFWCVYLVSLARDRFVKNPSYASYLTECGYEVREFVDLCRRAKIPTPPNHSRFREVLGWVLGLVGRFKPKAKYVTETGTYYQLELEFDKESKPAVTTDSLSTFINEILASLEHLLSRADLSMWLMVDRLDELFARRTNTETRALRALLRTTRVFHSKHVRLKIFLRDDILEQVTDGPNGLTALSHITGRQSDRLAWSEDQILHLIVNRLFASEAIRQSLGVDRDRLNASASYRQEAFYRVFPPTVHGGERQSKTLKWLYTHTMDGRNVVTPRDVIDLLTRAKQRQLDEFGADSEGSTPWIICGPAIQYGLDELSKRKRDTFLKAEFPHFWEHISKLHGGRTEYLEASLEQLFGGDASSVIRDLVSIGLLQESRRANVGKTYRIPYLYRAGLQLTQGLSE